MAADHPTLVEEMAQGMWEHRCPGIRPVDEDRMLYTMFAQAALAFLSTYLTRPDVVGHAMIAYDSKGTPEGAMRAALASILGDADAR